jgi:hypothetical protein
VDLLDADHLDRDPSREIYPIDALYRGYAHNATQDGSNTGGILPSGANANDSYTTSLAP